MVSSRNIRLALAVLVVTAVIGIVTVIFQKGSKSVSPEPVSQQLPQNIDVALDKARFSEMRAGKVAWELVAERAHYDRGGDVVYLTGIRMEFAKTRSAGSIVVTGDSGEYFVKQRNVKLRGRVRAVTENGASFETESIQYLAGRSSFSCTEQVIFRHQRMKLTANGVELDVKSQVARFQQPIEATVAGLQVH